MNKGLFQRVKMATEAVKEIINDQIATVKGKRYSDNTIIIGFGRQNEELISSMPKDIHALVKWDTPEPQIYFKHPEPDPYEKLVHPRNRDSNEFGCGYDYSHAVNAYYEHERRRKLLILKKHLPLIIGGGFLGGVIGLTLKALLTK